MPTMGQLLSDNGFEYHMHPDGIGTCVVKNLKIVNFEPMVKFIDVSRNFTIYINFNDPVPQVTNFGLDFDADGYQMKYMGYIMKVFTDENDFINELHRLNSTGSNIKG